MFKITDWDDAYANAANIPGGDRWPAAWVEPAQTFRDQAHCHLDVRYGTQEREVYDLFLPNGAPKGLVVFVHGGIGHTGAHSIINERLVYPMAMRACVT